MGEMGTVVWTFLISPSDTQSTVLEISSFPALAYDNIRTVARHVARLATIPALPSKCCARSSWLLLLATGHSLHLLHLLC